MDKAIIRSRCKYPCESKPRVSTQRFQLKSVRIDMHACVLYVLTDSDFCVRLHLMLTAMQAEIEVSIKRPRAGSGTPAINQS